MAFWSKLGKGLVKVGKYAAPIALGFIPGAGIPLAMAAGGALSAADTKMSGGSWKDALLSGGIGVASGYGGGQLGKFASSLGKGLATGTAKQALASGLGKTATAKVATGLGLGLTGMGTVQGIRSAVSETKDDDGGAGSTRRGIAPSYADVSYGSYAAPRNASVSSSSGSSGGDYGAMPRGYMGNEAMRNMSYNLDPRINPIAQSIQRGTRNAILSQPFRMGTAPPPETSQEEYDAGRPPGGYLPPIFPQGPYGRRVRGY